MLISGPNFSLAGSKAPRHEAAGLPDPLTAAVSPITVNLSLAKLAAQANKPDVAAQKYFEVLKTAWWCWEAFEGLCRIGQSAGTPYQISECQVISVKLIEDDLLPHF